MDVLDSKKQNISAVIEALAYHCTTDNEKAVVLEQIRRFRRKEDESFAACITRFDSLYVFYLQLEQPSERDVIKLMSYETIRTLTPYLISPKCAHIFGGWSKDTQLLGGTITLEKLIQYVTDLEIHEQYKNTQPRSLPSQLISTTLNLPPGTADITLNAHVATPTPTLPKPEQERPRNRSHSASDKKNFDRSASRGRDQSSRRQSSQSRGNSRNRQDSRGRSNERKKLEESKGSRSSSLCAEIEACQYYSVHSQSPNQRKVSIPSVFRRPLTPRSFNHMKGNYFLTANSNDMQKVPLPLP